MWRWKAGKIKKRDEPKACHERELSGAMSLEKHDRDEADKQGMQLIRPKIVCFS